MRIGLFTDAHYSSQEVTCKNRYNSRSQNMTLQGTSLLFLDACYFKNGNRYMPGDRDWTDTYYPHADALKKILGELSGEGYVFMHQNIDPNIPKNHRLSNADNICRIIEDSRAVATVYQGHYHPGKTSEHGGVRYVTLPAMCENDNAAFTVEI